MTDSNEQAEAWNAFCEQLKKAGDSMGFSHVASGPMVRSSYHADLQAQGTLENTG